MICQKIHAERMANEPERLRFLIDGDQQEEKKGL